MLRQNVFHCPHLKPLETLRKRGKLITYPQSGCSITHDERVCLSKIGSVKMGYHRPIRGKVKTCTVHCSSTGKWYVCFSVECEPKRLEPIGTHVGIDVELSTFATLSTGEEIENPCFFRKEEKAVARVQHKHSKLANQMQHDTPGGRHYGS